MLLEEFDFDKNAVIEPKHLIPKPVEGMPAVAVSCFEQTTFARMLEKYGGEVIARSFDANSEFPVYKTVYKGKPIALFMMSCGAPMCAALCEDVFQMGCSTIILYGTCGVLDSNISDCSLIIPDTAVRDEGTSYHYMPASDEIPVNERYGKAFSDMLTGYGIKHTVGKVWTTDAIYRETRTKIEKRKAQGCICVDMECSAAAAVSKFRNKDILHFFYAADALDSEEWDPRCLDLNSEPDARDKASFLAMEFAASVI